MFGKITTILYDYLRGKLINGIYDTIYIFSSFQIKYNKTKKYLLENGDQVKNKEDNNVDVYMYNDGCFMRKMKMEEYLKKWSIWHSECYPNFDYMVLSKKIDSNYNLKLINKKCHCCRRWPFELMWIESDINFVSISVIFNENDVNRINENNQHSRNKMKCEYPMPLKVNKDNYNVVGNIINFNFIKYYMMEYNLVELPENLDYIIQLFDHNAQLKLIKYPDEIEIGKKNYTIIKKNMIN